MFDNIISGNVGPGDGIKLFDSDLSDGILVGQEEVELDITLDSGCAGHVCGDSDAPGYAVNPSEGSRCGQNFVVGNGSKDPNRGQLELYFIVTEEEKEHEPKAIFQVAKVTRPLMSVSRIRDQRMICHVDAQKAVVKDPKGRIVCTCLRKGGLCNCRSKFKTPFEGMGIDAEVAASQSHTPTDLESV